MNVRNKVRAATVASLLAIGMGASAAPAFAGSHAYRVSTGSDCSVSVQNAAGKITSIKPGTAVFVVDARKVYVSKTCGLYVYKNSDGKGIFNGTGKWVSIPTTYGLTFTTYA